MSPPQENAPDPSMESRWISFARAYDLVDVEEAAALWSRFEGEMSAYTELIAGPRGQPAGTMFRGRGEDFTQRAVQWMENWDISPEDLSHYQEMADLYGHTNSFLKLEWHPRGERMATGYFRRRPPVRRVLHQLHSKGVSPDILKNLLWISKVLQKDSIHFVSAAYRPGKQLRYKLYFSQALRPDTWAQVVQRVLTLMAHLRTDQDTRNRFIQFHPHLAPPQRFGTLFLAFSFDGDGLHASFKLDYPDVAPALIAQLISGGDATFADLCQRSGPGPLTYLGVRVHPQQPLELKYYADLYP